MPLLHNNCFQLEQLVEIEEYREEADDEDVEETVVHLRAKLGVTVIGKYFQFQLVKLLKQLRHYI
jgi:hypothetical protein